jgi:flagellar protein FlbD
MIEVTRLNGNSMTINSDLIKIAEASPDTMLTLIHGEKLIVKESCEEVVEKVMAYRARLLAAVALQLRNPDVAHLVVGLSSLDPKHGVPGGGPHGTRPELHLELHDESRHE